MERDANLKIAWKSRIDYLARTYTYVPTNAERYQLEDLISRLVAQIFDTTDKDDTKQMLFLHDRVKLCNAIVAPIRRIPPEILGENFIHLKPPPPDYIHIYTVSEGEAPHLMSARIGELVQYVRLPLDMSPFIHEIVLLEDFTLEVRYRGNSDSDTCLEFAFPMTTLPKLRRLELICWNSDAKILPEFFDHVDLPVLQEFSLEFIMVSYLAHVAFSKMHERSGFNLVRLIISRLDIESVALARDILRRMPSLLSFETDEDPDCHAGRWSTTQVGRSCLCSRKFNSAEIPLNATSRRPLYVIESRWTFPGCGCSRFQKEGSELIILENTLVSVEKLCSIGGFDEADPVSDREVDKEFVYSAG